MSDQLPTAGELRGRLRRKPDTLIARGRRGRIPAHRLARKVIRFHQTDVIVASDPAMMSESAKTPARSLECTP